MIGFTLSKFSTNFLHLQKDYANGDVICRECGLVVGKVVDMGEEKRNFAESGVNRSRTSMTDPLLNDGGLRTQISDDGGGKAGVAQWHSRVQNSVEDAKLLNGYSQIEQIAELLKVNESTKVFYLTSPPPPRSLTTP